MISKYFEKYCSFYLSKYWVNKKKFENILKLKITKDFFQKKISLEKKTEYLNEISKVIIFHENGGFFDEKKLIDFKIESFKNKGYSIKKIQLSLRKNFFDQKLISDRIKNLELEDGIEAKLIDKYLSKSGHLKKIKINMNKSEVEKVLKKLLSQGFKYNQIVKYLKEKHKLYDFN